MATAKGPLLRGNGELHLPKDGSNNTANQIHVLGRWYAKHQMYDAIKGSHVLPRKVQSTST